MRTIPLLFLCLLFSGALQGATIFQTGFETSDGYSTGALGGNGWSISNAGANTEWIVLQNSTTPSAPTSLSGGKHPASTAGGSQMLWLSPNTTIVSGSQSALLSFTAASARIQEPFKLSMDIYASPTGGAGQSFTMYLTRADAASTTTVPRISFTSVNTSGMSLNVWNNSTSTTGVATLPKDSWVRLELNVNASTTSTGTYTISVYQLDSSGSVVSTLYSSSAFNYTLASGFDALRFLTNSSRTDYWVDNIQIATNAIPEPSVSGLLLGGSALVFCATIRRPRR